MFIKIMTYSLDIINLVIDKYNSNTSIIEIAQIININKNTMNQWKKSR
jgi:transposase-like protein